MIAITLPDGTVKQVSEGTTSLDVAMSISEGLARNVLAAEVDGEVWDPQRPLTGDCALKLLTCLLYTSPSPRDGLLSRMPSSA